MTRLEVGRVGKAHGLRGEVVVVPITNVPGRFVVGATLYAQERPLTISSSRPHQGAFLVRFDGVDDRNGAEHLRGLVLTADSLDTAPPGEVFVHELIGSVVRDAAGNELGRVDAVEANPAHDLLVLDDGRLVPMPFVVSIAHGTVVIDPPPGLFDL